MRDIAPVLQRRCAGCHGAKKSKGNYRLHTFEYLMDAVVPGKPEESDLYLLLLEEDPDSRMPQKDDPLSETETNSIREWIAQGAAFDGESPTKSFTSQAYPRTHPEPPNIYRVPVPIMALAYSIDGKELAVAGHHEVTIWDPETGVLLRRLTRLPVRIQSMKWLSEGKQLVIGGGTAGEYGELSLIDARTGERLTVLDTFEDLVLGIGIDMQGEHLAAVSADRTVRTYDLASGKRLWQSSVHSDQATSVAFSPDNRFVISTSRDETVKVLNTADGTLFTTYNGHRRNLGDFRGRFKVFSGCFDPNTGLALSVGEGKAIRIWDPLKAKEENGTAGDMEERFFKAGHTRYITHEFKGPAFALALTADHVYTAGSDGLIRSFEFASGKQRFEMKGHNDWVYTLALSSPTNRLATGAHDGEVRVWDTQDGSLIQSFIAAPGFPENH
ncbi:MAG: c-type cytochrome domain-containing protein [Verrucomicrobiales bacterium]